MTDIAPIQGLIELTDNFTSPIGLAEAALSNFSKANQESLKAVAGAAGIVVAGITAITAATIELGKRGSDVNDVNDTLTHFAGGANAANAAMQALREGTKGTVDNFNLAKDAAHLLSTGVQLTAQDFGTLGQAAFVLQNRGLGGTKEQLDLVSDAMVTGRTRALAMSLGVIASDDAQEKYAATLGISVDKLSDAGKVEANRIEVMRILTSAVKDAGVQQRDFGEEFEFAQTQVQNWVDDLGSAIAKSSVFAAGFKAIEEGVEGAFDGDKAQSIKTITSLIEDGAIKIVDFAQGTITMARVVEGAWEGVRTLVLGVETGIVALATAVAISIESIANNAANLHIISPGTAAEISSFRENLQGMTVDLASQTAEAGKAVFGHTAFDETLDKLSSGLSGVRDAMAKAKDSTVEETGAQNDAADAAKKNAAAQAELNARMIDQGKVSAALIKSSTELSVIWSDYYKLVAESSGTSRDAQIADIEATFDKQVAALDALDPLYQAKYTAYRATADASLKAISVDWDSVRDNSIEGLQQMADKALATYNAMMYSGLTFTRETLQGQLDKYHELSDKARGYGDDVKAAAAVAVSGVQELDHAWVTDADIAAAMINKTTVMIKTLSGELISLAEAEKRQQTGGSSDTTSANFAEQLKSYLTNGGWNPTMQGVQQYHDPYDLAKKGYSFAEIIKYAFQAAYQTGALPPAVGPRIPGFAMGGTVMVGENGPEVVRLPLGSTVYPNGMGASGGGGNSFNLTFNVNGTAQESARQIKDILFKELQTRRQF